MLEIYINNVTEVESSPKLQKKGCILWDPKIRNEMQTTCKVVAFRKQGHFPQGFSMHAVRKMK